MYFSVKNYIKIAGKTYVPCVCYQVKKGLEATVEKLVAEGKAVKYDEKVGFMNGKRLVKAKESKTVKAAETTEAVTEETAEETEGF